MVVSALVRRAAAGLVPLALLLPSVATATLCRGPLTAVADHVTTRQPLAALPFEVALTAVAALALAGTAAWLALVVLAAAVESLTGRSCAVLRAASPVAVRRLVLACGTVALGCGATLAPAVAAADVTSGSSGVDTPTGLAGLAVPDRPSGDLRPITRGVARTPAPTVVTVRSGDSLWAITAGVLPRPTTAAEVAKTWPVLYRANRRAVGADPELITPGMRLRVPSSLTSPAPAGGASPQDREDRP